MSLTLWSFVASDAKYASVSAVLASSFTDSVMLPFAYTYLHEYTWSAQVGSNGLVGFTPTSPYTSSRTSSSQIILAEVDGSLLTALATWPVASGATVVGDVDPGEPES